MGYSSVPDLNRGVYDGCHMLEQIVTLREYHIRCLNWESIRFECDKIICSVLVSSSLGVYFYDNKTRVIRVRY